MREIVIGGLPLWVKSFAGKLTNRRLRRWELKHLYKLMWSLVGGRGTPRPYRNSLVLGQESRPHLPY
jgi:hypothetical protein